MGKLNKFTIEIAQAKNVCFAGQWLQGYVCVELNEPMKMRGIRLSFFGGCKVYYTEETNRGAGHSRGMHERKEYIHYRSIETYFDHTMYVFGRADPSIFASNSPTLPAGRYHYPFQFLLPAWVPSSYEGQHGHVRYYLKSVIDKPWKHDHETRTMFTVVSHMDLNKIEDAGLPGEINGEKVMCCLCCASDPVTVNMNVERKGFVCGENIFLSGEIKNNSSRRMKSVKIVLEQKSGFHATESRHPDPHRSHGHIRSRSTSSNRHYRWSPCSHTKWESKKVETLDKGELAAGDTITFNQEAFKVPPIPPSFLSGCGVIDLQYYVTVILNPAGPSKKEEVPLKITIGTIPLNRLFTEYNMAAQQAGYQPKQPALPASAPPQGFMGTMPPPNAPPPYFAESIDGKKSVREEGESEFMHGTSEWAPSYPFYDFHNTPVPAANVPPSQLSTNTIPVPTIGFQPPTPEAEAIAGGMPEKTPMMSQNEA